MGLDTVPGQGIKILQAAQLSQKKKTVLKREGTYICLWLIHLALRQKATQSCEAIILQLKINKFLKIVLKRESEFL